MSVATGQAELRIAVVMTCFNRRSKTLACLDRLFTQSDLNALQLTLFILDDGSSDGTSAAIQERWPATRLLRGDGSLFWNRGMHRAYAAAMIEDHDAYVWLNDDTMLLPTAVRRIVDTWQSLQSQGIASIVAGSTYDASTGRWSYGGFRWREGWRRELVPAEPDLDAVVSCDTMNGNFTLIPREVVQKLGNLDVAFQHSFGDFDYGFRARAEGVEVHVAPGYFGSCSDNPALGTWRDRKLNFVRRWRHLRSPKGSPLSEWVLYCHRHLGPLWPLYAVSPYARTLLTAFRFPQRG